MQKCVDPAIRIDRCIVFQGMHKPHQIVRELEFSVRQSAVAGCLIGTAIGDSIGLPYEGLSARRAVRLLGPPDRHRLVFGRGMVSDDTEHACMVLQSLVASGGDVHKFQSDLAARLRWWLFSLPAGTGLATARAIAKLWLGFRPPRSGVFSAGNGPAMRSAILGVLLPESRLAEYVQASTEITHSDPKAKWGAVAVALASRLACRNSIVDGCEFQSRLDRLLDLDDANEFLELIAGAITAVEKFESTSDYSSSIGLGRGVSGYVYHTVPVAIHAWLRHQQDYRAAVEDVIRCGGDTDTTAAIVGGIVGAAVGPSGIPQEWQEGLCEWPLTLAWMSGLSEAATCGSSADSLPHLPFAARLARNAVLLPIVLAHGFRRLAPPY